MPKRVIILGSTGSIGCSALSVAENLPHKFEIVGLACGSRWNDLVPQIERFRPQAVAVADAVAAGQLASHLRSVGNLTPVWAGPQGVTRLVKDLNCDFVLAGIVGVSGLAATLAAVERGLTVGLANKESLVVAGGLMVEAAQASGAKLLPVDSEHSAVFQSLHAGRQDEVERILLTASGGPFRTWTREQMAQATLDDAMKHPTWNMGPKITIDSATMMNKALEIIEARWLFGIDPDAIEVVIHPESIIHSMVAFHDGSVLAQMGSPDMRTPIQYAMTYPLRLSGCSDRLDFRRDVGAACQAGPEPSSQSAGWKPAPQQAGGVHFVEKMTFEPPDEARFPALRLGHQVARQGGTAGAALNGANEAAVDAFRRGRISFLDIVTIIEDVLDAHPFEAHPDLTRLMEIDGWSRRQVEQRIPHQRTTHV